MNQNMTPQRTPERTPQRANSNGGARRNISSKYSTAFVVILIVTAILLFVSIVTLCIVAATGGFDRDPSGYSQNDDGDGGADKDRDTDKKEEQTEGNRVNIKTTVKLPSPTASGNYVSSASSVVEYIAEDAISSDAAILVSMDGNVSIAERNADTKVYPASMTKVMTLLVACENAKDPAALLTVTQEMVDYQRENGASGNLSFVAGEQITVEDALYLVNYRSDTISCLLLAEHISGSEAEFVKLMNKKARDIGASNTNFVNTTGLHDDDHYTTCRDMAAIVNCAMNNTTAKKIFTAYKEKTVNIYVDGEVSRSSPIYASWYSGRLGDNNWAGGGSDMQFVGGKTGNETIPSSCFATVAKDTGTGKMYICVTVGRITEDGAKVTDRKSTEDARIIYKAYAEGR